MIETRDPSGARMLVTTSDGGTSDSGDSLWTDNLTDGETDRKGALTALATAAKMIDDMARRYRAASSPARSRGSHPRP